MADPVVAGARPLTEAEQARLAALGAKSPSPSAVVRSDAEEAEFRALRERSAAASSVERRRPSRSERLAELKAKGGYRAGVVDPKLRTEAEEIELRELGVRVARDEERLKARRDRLAALNGKSPNPSVLVDSTARTEAEEIEFRRLTEQDAAESRLVELREMSQRTPEQSEEMRVLAAQWRQAEDDLRTFAEGYTLREDRV